MIVQRGARARSCGGFIRSSVPGMRSPTTPFSIPDRELHVRRLEFPRDRIADNGVDAEKTVDVLLRLASSAQMYRSSDGRLHAQVPVGDPLEMYRLKSAGFRDWLIDGYFSGRGQPASPWAIRRVSVCWKPGRGLMGGCRRSSFASATTGEVRTIVRPISSTWAIPAAERSNSNCVQKS
jgi:hypothetical protein